VGCVGLQRPSWPWFFTTTSEATLDARVVTQWHTVPYQRPAGEPAPVGRMCKGSGIKYVVHTLQSDLQRGCAVVTWAVAPVRKPPVPAHLTLGRAKIKFKLNFEGGVAPPKQERKKHGLRFGKTMLLVGVYGILVLSHTVFKCMDMWGSLAAFADK